jgi:hypothetical protein
MSARIQTCDRQLSNIQASTQLSNVQASMCPLKKNLKCVGIVGDDSMMIKHAVKFSQIEEVLCLVWTSKLAGRDLGS